MTKCWVIAMMLALWAPLRAIGPLTPEEKRALEVKPAVALVVVQYETKWTYGDISVKLAHGEMGAGFFIHPDGYLITNAHVVEHANLKNPQALESLKAELRSDAIKTVKNVAAEAEKQGHKLSDQQIVDLLQHGKIELLQPPTLKVLLANGEEWDAVILQYSAPITENGNDVALLKAPGSDYPTVRLGDSGQLRLHQAVMVMSYPGLPNSSEHNSYDTEPISGFANKSSPTNGHISAIKEGPSGVPLIESDAAITHVNSGGPAFNDRGEVIGIAIAGAEQQGFNFLVPIDTAMELVRKAGVHPTRGVFDRHWDAALDLYASGKYRKSIGEFDNALQFMADLPDAKKYRAAALIAEDQLSSAGRLLETTGKAPLYAAGMILLLGTTALFSWPFAARRLNGRGRLGHFIGYLPSLFGHAAQFHSCFISHSTKDKEFAERIWGDLRKKGVRCWYAPEDLKVGDVFPERIEEAIHRQDKLLIVLSEASVDSTWVEKELRIALEYEDTSGKRVLFPVRVDDAVSTTGKAGLVKLRDTRHIGDFTGWKHRDSYQKAFERLLRDLKAEESGIKS